MARQHSTLAAVGGFFLGPAVVGIAASLALKASASTNPGGSQSQALLTNSFAFAHALGTAGAYWAADKYPAYHSLLRGAMWGEGVSTVFAAIEANQLITPKATTTAVSTTAPAQGVQTLARRVLQGGWFS